MMRGLTIGMIAVGLSVGGGLMLSQAHSFAVDFTYLTLGPNPEKAPELSAPSSEISAGVATTPTAPLEAVIPAAAGAPVVVSQMPRLPQPEKKDTIMLTSLGNTPDLSVDEPSGETSVAPVARVAPVPQHYVAPKKRSVSTRSVAPQAGVQKAQALETTPNAVPRYLIGVYR